MARHEVPSNPLERLRPITLAQFQAGLGWLRERELSQQQAFILDFLVRRPGAIQREIAAASGTTPANVSAVLRGLEARGLVTRRPEDERSKTVWATERGVALISGREQAMAAADESIVRALTAVERRELTRLLDKLVANLPAVGEATA